MKRVFLLVATNFAILLVLGIVLAVLQAYFGVTLEGYGGLLVLASVFGFGGAFISLAMSKWVAKRSTGAHVITQPRNETEAWLVSTVKRQAEAAGIAMPEVAIYDAPEMNAFATGPSRNNSLVAVSTGLMRGMTRDEVEAVLGHEVSHVANGDMVTMTLLQGVLNTFVIFLSRIIGGIVDRVVFKNDRGYGPGYWISVILAQIVLGILASMIAMAFSRYREFRADEGGARLSSREKMVAALERLGKSYGQSTLPESVEAFGISGRVSGGMKRLFMSHPPLAERISRLRNG